MQKELFIEETISKNQKIKIKLFNLENRRYIGSKTKLITWIFSLIDKHTKDCESFFDVFGGTGVVSKEAANHFDKIIINDILYSNTLIYKAFFEENDLEVEEVNKWLDYYNSLDIDSLEENYFSENFGNKYFTQETAKFIGFIRNDIEDNKQIMSSALYYHLITSLIYSMDRVANTVGHFEAYIRKDIKQSERLIISSIKSCPIKDIEIYRKDANELVHTVQSDIAYIDPPYNSRQYSRFYHVYENLIKWEKPTLYGVAMKPEPENMSSYCTVKAKDSFEDLINNINSKYIIVSYNNTYNSKSSSAANKISLEDIFSIFSLQKTFSN